ncbi:tRNA splicing endonuclease-like protein subunit [Lepidopterella palustris CBS 459.81]|uniref:tRNA splicing endonuclease-like protein subunit n=1 Tax=Lepidopterella palustris CBS 459.81 TaxID=1314670 RepID=A0A8E2JLJ1_9PEZI|nr:tRNA splicing endonuclease-like protein subunit [Lepidopterella palustris CBS 459.81]
MADEDEDIPQFSSANAGDIDLSDETQDFRFLSNLSISGTDLPKIPKRGEKDFEPYSTSLQSSTLAASRAAMHTALSIPRIHPPKTHIVAIYDPQSNMAYVDKVKSQHFQTMGKFVRGREWLLPEEALFMLERGSLDVRWPVINATDNDESGDLKLGVPMSLQGAYAAFIGMEDGVGGKLTLEMYNVYAGLKRSGYIVFRTGDWKDEARTLNLTSVAKSDTENINTKHWSLGLFADMWNRLSTREASNSANRLALGPLVTPGIYRSYSDIYRLLELIPTHDRSTPPSFLLPADSSNHFRITYDIYKPSGKFRKTARGPPDYQVAVVNARETSLPTMAELNDLLATTPHDPPSSTGPLYQKLKYGSRNIILAIVDQGIPSYIRIADASFGEEKLHERKGRAPRGKLGGHRGRGRGRGRGR